MHIRKHLHSTVLSARIIYINQLQTEVKANIDKTVCHITHPLFGRQFPEETLCDSFSWDHSPEGYYFWNNIWKQIKNYAHKFKMYRYV